ncbi:cytochrome c551 [Brevibacillus massiliensis]|jgi:cytochrome c551|uniref:cytochrome c551 n=1 Tax=Brevibacillus massiliensis TaxID=1118054 RepID=UPI00030C63B2|nr:cytochrome c [Brevibacillus massiliensis]
MKRFSFILLAGAMVLVLGACGKSAQPAPQQPATPPAEQPAKGGETTTPTTEPGATAGEFDAAKAEAVYKQNCSSCHGVDLKGAVGPDLTKIGDQLSKDDILGVINNGKGIMPKGLVSGADADNLAAWLASHK